MNAMFRDEEDAESSTSFAIEKLVNKASNQESSRGPALHFENLQSVGAFAGE